MSSTILTVIVLVVMWVVVLVPMLLRRREVADETRTVERFSSAMRVLSRRTPPAAEIPAVQENAPPVREDSAPMTVPTTSARADMLARRRRALGTLVVLAIITAIVALAIRPAAWIGHGVVDLLLVAYLVWLRQEARREQRRRQRRAERRARGEVVAHTNVVPVRRTAPGAEREAVMAGAMTEPIATVEVPPGGDYPVDGVTRRQDRRVRRARSVPLDEGPYVVALDDGDDPDFSAEYDVEDEIVPRRVVNG